VGLRLRLTALSVGLTVVAFACGLPFGILGVAVAFAAASFLTELYFIQRTLGSVHAPPSLYAANLSGVLTAVAGMGVGLYALGLVLSTQPAGLVLALGVAVGPVLYLALLRLWAPQVLSDGLALLFRRRKTAWKPA